MAKLVFQMSRILLVFGIHERAGFPCLAELLSSANGYLVHHSPKGHFWCHYFIPCPWKCGFWYTVCHTFDILDQVICVIVLMAAILDAILNLTASVRDPDCPHKFFYYQDQESKWGDIWLHTGPPSDPGLHHFICKGQTFVYLPDLFTTIVFIHLCVNLFKYANYLIKYARYKNEFYRKKLP